MYINSKKLGLWIESLYHCTWRYNLCFDGPGPWDGIRSMLCTRVTLLGTWMSPVNQPTDLQGVTTYLVLNSCRMKLCCLHHKRERSLHVFRFPYYLRLSPWYHAQNHLGWSWFLSGFCHGAQFLWCVDDGGGWLSRWVRSLTAFIYSMSVYKQPNLRCPCSQLPTKHPISVFFVFKKASRNWFPSKMHKENVRSQNDVEPSQKVFKHVSVSIRKHVRRKTFCSC